MKAMDEYRMIKEEITNLEEQLKEAKKGLYIEVENYIRKVDREVTVHELCKFFNCNPCFVNWVLSWGYGRRTIKFCGHKPFKKQFVELDADGQPTGKLITRKYEVDYWGLR